MKTGVLAMLICGLAAVGLSGCGESESSETKTEYVACDQTGPVAYWYPIGSVADSTKVSEASASVRSAFTSTVDQRPKVGVNLSQQGSRSEDRWIVLKDRGDSVFFGGLAADGQVTHWFNGVREQGRWSKARLSDCEMLRVVKNGQSAPLSELSGGEELATANELTVAIRNPRSGCDYEPPQIETAESDSSVTVTAQFHLRETSEEVICVGMLSGPDTRTVSAQLDRPLGDRQVFDGSFVPARLVAASGR